MFLKILLGKFEEVELSSAITSMRKKFTTMTKLSIALS